VLHEARLTINSRRWRIKLVRAKDLPKDWLGDCDHPPGPHPTIRVRRNLPQQRLASVIAHEVLHAAVPSLDEATVQAASDAIGRAMFLLQFRRIKQSKEDTCRRQRKASDS
jgi:hypothetical protein